MSVILGLTGGIATGKSTITKLFAAEKIPVVDADIVSRDLLNKDGECFQKVIDAFGEDVVSLTGEINRKLLGRMIFDDSEKREKLNKIVHPIVRKIIENRLEIEKRDSNIVLLVVPLMFEVGFDDLCDKIIAIDVSETNQVERLMIRDNISREDAIKRVASQMNTKEKIKKADYVINNNESIIQAKKDFKNILEKMGTTS